MATTKNYIIKSLSVAGRGNRVYKAGQIVPETAFYHANIQRLIDNGSIAESLGEMKKIEGKLKVAIVSAVWKRPEVFEMFAKGIKHLIDNMDIEFTVVIAGSEWQTSQKMVEKHGFNYIEIPNQPLAAKHNSTTFACQFLDVDYVLCLGSDDIISLELMKEYEINMRNGFDFIGVTDFYFYDTLSKKYAYWGGYREKWRLNHTCGAGRIISARLMAHWEWMPWENKHSKILDNSMEGNLAKISHSKKIFSLKEKGLFALDIKSSTNMTPFQLWDNTEFIENKEISNHFKYIF